MYWTTPTLAMRAMFTGFVISMLPGLIVPLLRHSLDNLGIDFQRNFVYNIGTQGEIHMAANLDSVMTWEQAREQFESEVFPYVQAQYEQDGVPDWPARREAWNNWKDSL